MSFLRYGLGNFRCCIWKEKFSSVYLDIIRHYIPCHTITVRRKNKVWMNSTLHKLSRKKHRLFKRFQHTKRQADWQKYKDFKNFCNAEFTRHKKQYFRHLHNSIQEEDFGSHRWWTKAKRMAHISHPLLLLFLTFPIMIKWLLPTLIKPMWLLYILHSNALILTQQTLTTLHLLVPPTLCKMNIPLLSSLQYTAMKSWRSFNISPLTKLPAALLSPTVFCVRLLLWLPAPWRTSITCPSQPLPSHQTGNAQLYALS